MKKTARPRLKVKYHTKIALAALGLVLGLLLLGKIASLAHNFYQPFTPSAVERSYLWEGDSNINVLIRGEQIFVVSYNPNEQKIITILVPDETYIEAPGGFGVWPARSIYGLGGNILLQKSLAAFLAAPIDGYIELKADLKEKSPTAILKIWGNPFNFFHLISNLETNLTPYELLNLSLSARAVRFDKIHHLDLNDILTATALPDKTNILISDPVKVDAISQSLAESQLVSEQLTVAVFNATNHPGLAQKAARIVTNMGGDVIVISNTNLQEKSMVIQDGKSFTKKRLSQIFAPLCLQNHLGCSIIDLASRAQVDIILGEDFYKQTYGD